jgi:hypothetical protein
LSSLVSFNDTAWSLLIPDHSILIVSVEVFLQQLYI